jgi:hypothetical protein
LDPNLAGEPEKPLGGCHIGGVKKVVCRGFGYVPIVEAGGEYNAVMSFEEFLHLIVRALIEVGQSEIDFPW